jgi:hypothetical protein
MEEELLPVLIVKVISQGSKWFPRSPAKLIIETIVSDLLRRHIRTYHPQIQVPRPRKLKACSACHARKYRCEGGFPCNACQARGIICVRAGDEIVNEQQNFIDDLFASEDIPTVDESPPTASRWIAHDYVDIYFDYFHSAWPFLHRGTFDFAQEPCVLVQSVVAIGMWVEGSRKTRDASICLHGRLCSAFYAQMVPSYENLTDYCLMLTLPFFCRTNGACLTRVQARAQVHVPGGL